MKPDTSEILRMPASEESIPADAPMRAMADAPAIMELSSICRARRGLCQKSRPLAEPKRNAVYKAVTRAKKAPPHKAMVCSKGIWRYFAAPQSASMAPKTVIV